MGTVRLLLALLAAAAVLLPGCRRETAPPPPPPGLARTEAALEAGRFGEARKELRALDLRLLGTAVARLRAARAAAKVREFDLAARALDPDAAGDLRKAEAAALLRAEALARAGRLEDARKALAALEAAGLRGERWRVVYAMVSIARGERQVARDGIEALVKAGSRDPDVWVLWAQEALGFPPEAERRVRQGLDRAEDRAPLLKALGRVLLAGGDPARAVDHLRAAVRASPWDRDARLDLVRALTGSARPEDLAAAVEEAGRLLAEDGEDAEFLVAAAEAHAAKGIDASRRAGDSPGAGFLDLEEAVRRYGELLRRGATDPATPVRLLQGLARVLTEEIPLDPSSAALDPGSRYARAMAALDRAQAADPEGRLAGAWGVRSLAETFYLKGRACKRVHAGDKDHTDAVGWYRQAVEADPRHLEASWDLALLYFDFLRTPEYIEKARALIELHLAERERRGLAALDAERMEIAAEIRKLASEGKGRER